jgi:hypothetical protein
MLLVEGDVLCRGWARHQAAAASVVADPVVIDDCDIVNVDVPDDRRIHACDGAVVVEVVVIPIAALIARAKVAVAVIHAAIKAQVRSPVAVVPQVAVAVEAPIARRP